MNIKDVKKWVDTAEIGSSAVYYTGNLAEDRCYDKSTAIIPNAFAEHAKEKTVEFFQKEKQKWINQKHLKNLFLIT